MGLFLSTTINRIDSKGRVSVPGPFRAALGDQLPGGIVVMRSPLHSALEGFAYATMDDIAQRLDRYPMFSHDQDDLAASILAEAVPLGFDGEGRVVIPSDLLNFAGIKDQIAFVGLGRKFQLWEPGAWNKRRDSAQKSVRAKGLNLPAGGAE